MDHQISKKNATKNLFTDSQLASLTFMNIYMPDQYTRLVKSIGKWYTQSPEHQMIKQWWN
jgi:hypothetical protein